MAQKKYWVQGAIENEGRLRKYFKVKEGEKIPPEKIDAEITRLSKKTEAAGGTGLTDEEQSLLSALRLAKRMRTWRKRK